MHQREGLKSNILRINIIAAVALILLSVLLQLSCDFRQNPISKSKTDHLLQSVHSTIDTIKTISEQNMGNSEMAETLETDFGLLLSVEKTVIVGGSDKTEILMLPYSDITDIILNSGLSNINDVDGYKQTSGTIPAPKKGILNGYWLEAPIDFVRASEILDDSVAEANAMMLFDETEKLYNISLTFSTSDNLSYTIIIEKQK